MIDRLFFADGFNLNIILSHLYSIRSTFSSYGNIIIVKENTIVAFIEGFFQVEYVDDLEDKVELKEKFGTKIRRMRGFLE